MIKYVRSLKKIIRYCLKSLSNMINYVIWLVIKIYYFTKCLINFIICCLKILSCMINYMIWLVIKIYYYTKCLINLIIYYKEPAKKFVRKFVRKSLRKLWITLRCMKKWIIDFLINAPIVIPKRLWKDISDLSRWIISTIFNFYIKYWMDIMRLREKNSLKGKNKLQKFVILVYRNRVSVRRKMRAMDFWYPFWKIMPFFFFIYTYYLCWILYFFPDFFPNLYNFLVSFFLNLYNFLQEIFRSK